MPFKFFFLSLTYKHTLYKNNKTVISFTSSLSYYCLFDLSLAGDVDCVRQRIEHMFSEGIYVCHRILCSSCQLLIRIKNKHSGIEKCMVKYTNHQNEEKVNIFNCYYLKNDVKKKKTSSMMI